MTLDPGIPALTVNAGNAENGGVRLVGGHEAMNGVKIVITCLGDNGV